MTSTLPTTNQQPAVMRPSTRQAHRSGPATPARKRRRLARAVSSIVVLLALSGVAGVGAASSANAATLTIGTSCSELYWNGSFWHWMPALGGWRIVDRYYGACVTGSIFVVRGTGYWFAVR